MSKSILPFNQVYQNATLLASNLDSFFVLSTDDKIETVKQEGLFLYSQAVIDAQSYSMTMIPHIYENMLSTARGTELYIIIRRNIADDLNKALKEAAKSGSINMCKHVLESASYLEIEKSYVLSGAFKTAAYEQKFDVAIYLLKEMQNISDLDPRETEFWVSYGPHMDDDDYITAFEWACLNGYHDFADKLCHFDLTRPAKSFFTA
ncbi:MAG: hypothetical protein J0G32_06505, partial [Alphaproteobacteria bacterium]|nr:hypothetical protein [Alphaproteobacteria bacterium]